MKQVIATRLVDIPDDVTFEIKARKIRVKGPRGGQHQLDIQPAITPTVRFHRNVALQELSS